MLHLRRRVLFFGAVLWGSLTDNPPDYPMAKALSAAGGKSHNQKKKNVDSAHAQLQAVTSAGAQCGSRSVSV